jgi:transposase
MAARLSAKKLPRYSLDFKRKAVKLTEIPGMEVQVVAKALDIHPVMLSRWRQEEREGRLRGVETGGEEKRGPKVLVRVVKVPKVPVRELKRLQDLERAHAVLQEEHDILKKAIRFCSEKRQTSLNSSKPIRESSR